MKRYMLLFILVLAVAAFGQEGMEAATEDMDAEMMADTAAVDTMADDMSMDFLEADSAAVMEEEAPMEESGDALEAMLADEGTEMVAASGSELIGYTVGLDVGYPVYLHGGLGSSYDESAPAIGVVVNTPFGVAVGPLNIGFGAQIGTFGFSNSTVADREISGIYALATANTSVYETPQGNVAVQVGAGYFGASLGFTGGAAFNYVIPDMPIVVKPYLRANATLDSGGEASGDENAGYLWLNVGVMLSYDISTLF
ncbi:MAG: hypothetical protein K9N35_01565 [Candidatus Marinimicrobia bacterium]|nr:hypothetical protein [Candidatus Neomarinimicrobiota bacterium]